MNEMISQLQALIDNAEANRTDAEKWRQLIYLLGDIGYGPRITPQQIASLVPVPEQVMSLVVATQEVATADTVATKSGRRKLTADDRTAIHQLAAQLYPADEIAAALGIARSVVEKELSAAH